ncbi:g9686 [Coccomyxa elongata]
MAREGSSKEVLVRPVEPGPEDCCQSGCLNCVWEVYRRELAVYNQQLAVQEGRPAPPVVLDPFEELERKIQREKEEREKAERKM